MYMVQNGKMVFMQKARFFFKRSEAEKIVAWYMKRGGIFSDMKVVIFKKKIKEKAK